MHFTDRTRVRLVLRLDGECRLQSVLRAPSTAVPVTCRRGWPVVAARPWQCRSPYNYSFSCL